MSNLNPILLKSLILNDYHSFVKYFFKVRYKRKLQDAPHVKIICETLQRCVEGEFNRLIINIPTGHSKSLLSGEMLIPYCMAKNRYAKNIILSFTDSISHRTSQSAKQIMDLPEYQKLFPQQFNVAENSKSFWRNKQGGGLLATSATGSVTGHDAGSVPSDPDAAYEFDGLLVWDDPQKPKDIHYKKYRETINTLYSETVESRLRNPKAPLIIVMQRLHDEDISAYLLRGGASDHWKHLILPARIEEDYEYPKDYIHGEMLPHNLPVGPLWESKTSLQKLEEDLKYTPFAAWAQKMQRPLKVGGGLFKDEWWSYYDFGSINFDYRFITVDTASKTKTHNDYTVMQVWGVKTFNGVKRVYLIDQLRDKWEAPDLEQEFRSFYIKHRGTGTQTTNALRYAKIEDSSAGTGLIQRCSRLKGFNIIGITRTKDKYTRVLDLSPEIARGNVLLPIDMGFTSDLKKECREFTADDQHDHDDQVDCMLDAIDEIADLDDLQSGALY